MDETWIAEYPDFERSHFWWRTRRDLIRRLIDRHADSSGFGERAAAVLDIGCGSGVLLGELAQDYDVTGIEPGPVVGAAPGLPIIRTTLEEARFDPSSFDVVLMLDVLEHLDDPTGALQHIRDWGRRDCVLLVTVPAFKWLWSEHDEQNAHRTRYTRREVRDLLVSAGWEVRDARYLFGLLVLPRLMQVMLERVGWQRGASKPSLPPAWVNAAAYRLLWFEVKSVSRWMPAGTSVLGVATKRPPG